MGNSMNRNGGKKTDKRATMNSNNKKKISCDQACETLPKNGHRKSGAEKEKQVKNKMGESQKVLEGFLFFFNVMQSIGLRCMGAVAL